MREKSSKEIEIALLKQNLDHLNTKVDDIHRILVGNGRKGLKDEMTYIKGGLYVTWAIMTLVVAIAAILM